MVQHYGITAVQKSKVDVEFRVAANPPYTAHGHDGRYGQVFRNVIDNALSFSPPGSRLLVELSRQPRGGSFVVTIDDEGPGIPEENLESIFQRFYSQRPTEHFGQHSGLGLSICRQIMETYGGSISASNRKAADGRILGARFTIRVPAADARQ
jgi:two-component system sensor histidine kinase ChvG